MPKKCKEVTSRHKTWKVFKMLSISTKYKTFCYNYTNISDMRNCTKHILTIDVKKTF